MSPSSGGDNGNGSGDIGCGDIGNGSGDGGDGRAWA
jgi:hypothetical protein